jgi:hypothetical protein
MEKRALNRVFVAGVVAPFAAVLIYGLVYSLMTSLSRDVEKDWGFRLFVAAVAMALPSVLTFVLAFRQSRQKKLSMLSKSLGSDFRHSGWMTSNPETTSHTRKVAF